MFANALRFKGINNEAATVTSVAAIEGLDPWSLALWVRIRSSRFGSFLASKGISSSNNRRVAVITTTAGALQATVDRATTDMVYTTVSGVVFPGHSYVVIVTFNSANAAGDVLRFYLSKDGGPLVKINVATATAGSGAFQSDVGANLVFGNDTGGGANSTIDLFAAALANIEWTQSEAQGLAKSFWNPAAIRGVKGAWQFGRNSGATVFDASGNGRNAAIALVPTVGVSWSKARATMRRLSTINANNRRLALMGVGL